MISFSSSWSRSFWLRLRSTGALQRQRAFRPDDIEFPLLWLEFFPSPARGEEKARREVADSRGADGLCGGR